MYSVGEHIGDSTVRGVANILASWAIPRPHGLFLLPYNKFTVDILMNIF